MHTCYVKLKERIKG